MMWHQEKDTFCRLFKRSFLNTFPGCEARLSERNLNTREVVSKKGKRVANCISHWSNLCSPE